MNTTGGLSVALAVLGVIAIAMSIFALTWLVFGMRASRVARENLTRGLDEQIAQRDEEREARPKARPGIAMRITPGPSVQRIAGWLGRGTVVSGTLERVLKAKLVLVIVGVVLGVVIALTLRSALGYALAVTLVVAAYFIPEGFVYTRSRARKAAIEADLADILDQLTIAVEAGLGFEAAVSRISRNSSGPLSEELVRTLQDIQLGMSRREAYRALATRAGVPDLARFVRAVIQADIYGIPISTVLRTQSAEARLKRRQRIEEQAQKIPVKVTFPLMVCLMPVLFIIVLGPAIIGVMGSF